SDGPGARRWALPLGAALLTFVAWTKLFPALLVIPLLVERRWRALGWTVGWAVIWLLLTSAVLGPAPVVAFFAGHIGRVSSGAAFPFIADNERIIAANLSAYALALKVAWLAGSHSAPRVATLVTAVYGLGLALALALAAPRRPSRAA